jgi:hypothetical protein
VLGVRDRERAAQPCARRRVQDDGEVGRVPRARIEHPVLVIPPTVTNSDAERRARIEYLKTL